MARVEQRRANKNYPEHGIAKGQTYYYCQLKTGPRSSRVMRQLQPFRRSQLTTSEFLSQAYDLSDRLDAATTKDELETIKDEFETLRDETQDKYDNMPEGLQGGDTGQLLQERVDQCESLIEELDTIISELEWDEDEPATEADAVRGAVESGISNLF